MALWQQLLAELGPGCRITYRSRLPLGEPSDPAAYQPAFEAWRDSLPDVDEASE